MRRLVAVAATGAGAVFPQETAFPEDPAAFYVVSERVPQRPDGGSLGAVSDALGAEADKARRWAGVCCTSIFSKKGPFPEIYPGREKMLTVTGGHP